MRGAAAEAAIGGRPGADRLRWRPLAPIGRFHAMTRYRLFQRDDCHLCDLALEVLAVVRLPEPESVFIDGDDALEARYGHRVPVLRDEASGAELDWPFDPEQVRRWQG